MSIPPDRSPRRVLVLGAQGALGSLIVKEFRRAGWAVVAGARRPSPDPAARHVDLAEPDTVAAALSEVDVVVNPVPDPGLVAERMVLEHGGALVNVSAMPAAAGRRLRAQGTSEQVATPRGTVLMNAGIAPGITNLVAADLLHAHRDADEVEMVFTVSTNSTTGPAASAFAHRGLTSSTHHDTAYVPLPAPFGARRCLGFAETDAGWLGPVAAGRAVHTYIHFSEPPVHTMMLALNRTRLISHLPLAVLRAGATRSRGEEASREPIAHWVAVLRQGRRLAARTLEGTGDYRMTAAISVIYADALLGADNGAPAVAGVWNPEDLLSLDRLATPLQEAGVRLVDRVDLDRSPPRRPGSRSTRRGAARGATQERLGAGPLGGTN